MVTGADLGENCTVYGLTPGQILKLKEFWLTQHKELPEQFQSKVFYTKSPTEAFSVFDAKLDKQFNGEVRNLRIEWEEKF